MIDAWLLVWIIPLSAFAGMVTLALCIMSKRNDIQAESLKATKETEDDERSVVND